jgi:predicted anti-sigma-YlaC factor YlaD
MACEPWREMLSAQLDGEDDPADRERVDEHLAGCAGCREWLDRAAMVNRLTRTGPAADVPDLSAAILAALPSPAVVVPPGRPVSPGVVVPPGRPVSPGVVLPAGRAVSPGAGGGRAGLLRRVADRGIARGLSVPGWLTRARLAAALYLGLAAIGAVQLILGLRQVGGASGEHVHAGVDAAAGHLWHESAAWNAAVGAGYLFIALRRNRPTGLVPMLTAFVGMLLLLSVNDLTADRVDGTRLVSHGFVILGYLLIVALSRVEPDTARPPGSRAGVGSGWRADFGADEDARAAGPATFPPGLRLVRRGPLTAGLDTATPAEHHRAA